MADHLGSSIEDREETPDSKQTRNLGCVVTHHGVPAAVVMDFEDFYSLVTKAELLSDPDVVQDILQSNAEILQGRTIPIDEALCILSEDAASESALVEKTLEAGRSEDQGSRAEGESEPHVFIPAVRDDGQQQAAQAIIGEVANEKWPEAIDQQTDGAQIRHWTEILRGISISLDDVVLKLTDVAADAAADAPEPDKVLSERDILSNPASASPVEDQWAVVVSPQDLIVSEAKRRTGIRQSRGHARARLGFSEGSLTKTTRSVQK